MTVMKRLSEMNPGGLESQLIRAGQREAPAAAARQAAAAAGSLALAGTLVPRVAAASVGPKAVLMLAAKGMLAGAIVTGAVVAFTGAPRPSAVANEAPRVQVIAPPKVAPATLPPALPAVPPAPDRVVTGSARSASDGGGGGSRAPSKRSAAVSEKVPPRATVEPIVLAAPAPANLVATSPRPRFVDELRAFETAHAAFTRGNVSSAETALGAYQRDFPGGALALEAEVLRIELLYARGNAQAVRARAQAFLLTHPTAPAARRVRKLLEQSEGALP